MTTKNDGGYLFIEVPDFGLDPEGRPMSSYLHLGAIAGPRAGGELAGRVASFVDDARDKCDPPSLDVAPAPAPVLTEQADVRRLRDELDAQKKLAADLRESLERILPDPAAWLDRLVAMRDDAQGTVQAKQRQLDAALAAAATEHAARTGDARRVPPTHAAPGYPPPATAQPPASGYTRYFSKAERQDETALLHTKGGWRDHTDGNRVSTTRGDKVEVVGGNYRLVVLGRTDQPVDASGAPALPGWDMSGGHVDEASVSRVVPETAISWKQRWNGTWCAMEKSQRGDVVTTTTGDTEDEAYGHHTTSFVGSERPAPWHEPEACPGGACRTNPKIIDRTWAEHQLSHVGSDKQRVAKMTDETFATKLVSESHADTLEDRRYARTMTTKTAAETITNTTKAGAMETSTVAGHIRDDTWCTSRTSITTSGTITNTQRGTTETHVWGLSTDVFLGAQLSMTAGWCTNTILGAQLSIFVGVQASLTLGIAYDKVAGPRRAFSWGNHDETTVGTKSKLTPILMIKGAHVDVG